MSCWSDYKPGEGAEAGKCPECEGPVDADGDSLLESCSYSPTACDACKWSPCDGSC
jgi:hypothetical protein